MAGERVLLAGLGAQGTVAAPRGPIGLFRIDHLANNLLSNLDLALYMPLLQRTERSARSFATMARVW